MNRLTQRDDDSYAYEEHALTRGGSCTGVTRTKNQAIDKLGRLEDIEEDIGCPLDALFKAMKQGLFYKGYPGGSIKKFVPDGQQFIAPDLPNEALLLLYTSAYEDSIIIEHSLDLDCYGTEWALTKEELQ